MKYQPVPLASCGVLPVPVSKKTSARGAWASAFSAAIPGSSALPAEEFGTDRNKVYVYPNPATSESLAEFQEMQPNSEDPTGLRVRFANLPLSPCTIKIFTLDGDLVKELEHDGSGGYGECSWNLLTKNGQQVVSGIYLFSVTADEPGFDRQIGKFVVVR